MHYTLFWCSSSINIQSVHEEKYVLRHLVRNELKTDLNMESLSTEEGMGESVDVIRNVCMLSTLARNIISDVCSSKKLLAKDRFFDELGYTYLISRCNLKEAGAVDRKKSDWGWRKCFLQET